MMGLKEFNREFGKLINAALSNGVDPKEIITILELAKEIITILELAKHDLASQYWAARREAQTGIIAANSLPKLPNGR